MANGNGDSLLNGDYLAKLSANTITTSSITTGYASLYDSSITVPNYNDECGIDDITGREMLEVIQKGVHKTLVNRRDDAKDVWEEEDDDASYGEYKALKDAVELLEAFIKQAPHGRYSGIRRRDEYNSRYDGYGRRY